MATDWPHLPLSTGPERRFPGTRSRTAYTRTPVGQPARSSASAMAATGIA